MNFVLKMMNFVLKTMNFVKVQKEKMKLGRLMASQRSTEMVCVLRELMCFFHAFYTKTDEFGQAKHGSVSDEMWEIEMNGAFFIH